MIKDRAEVSGGSRPATQSGARPEAEDGQMACNLHCQPLGASAPGPSGLPTRKGAFEPRQERAETEFQPRNAKSTIPSVTALSRAHSVFRSSVVAVKRSSNSINSAKFDGASCLYFYCFYHLFEQEFQAAYKWGHKREKQ